MEYFLMKPYQGGQAIRQVNHDKEVMVFRVTKKGDAPDFTMRPRPLISNRFKELMEQYLPDMEFIPCVEEETGEPRFWMFHPKEQPPEEAQFSPDGSVCAVRPMGLTPIFMVPNYKKVSYVVNLPLAESLLRRGYVNMELERIETVEAEADAG